MQRQSTQKAPRNQMKAFCALTLVFVASSAMAAPLVIIDPYLVLNPGHRRSALDSNGGASLNVQSNVSNAQTRPQTFSIATNLPFIRDTQNVQSGWGLGAAVFLSRGKSSSRLQSYDSNTIEVSLGRSTIVESLAKSVGLQGFFEAGLNQSSTAKDTGELTDNTSIARKRRSFFLRFGALSLDGGQGIVNFMPYSIDQGITTSLIFPIDFTDTVLSFTHTAQLQCFWSHLKCGTSLNYTKYSGTLRLSNFAEPLHWIAYGPTLALYFYDRSAIFRTRILWDSIKTTDKTWVNTSIPTVNADISLVF